MTTNTPLEGYMFDLIYADSQRGFAQVFDLGMFRDGLDLEDMERETREMFFELEGSWLNDARVEDVSAVAIIDAIREAGADVGCPVEWMGH